MAKNCRLGKLKNKCIYIVINLNILYQILDFIRLDISSTFLLPRPPITSYRRYCYYSPRYTRAFSEPVVEPLTLFSVPLNFAIF